MIDPVRSFFLAVPYPVDTITSPSVALEATRCTSIVDFPSIETSCVAKPTEEIISVVTDDRTVSLKEPSVPVVVPDRSCPLLFSMHPVEKQKALAGRRRRYKGFS